MAAGREQVAASALARAHPGPAAVPVGHARQVLRAREADLAEPALRPQPSREHEKRVVAQLEGHDRPHAGVPHRVANAHELGDVEAGRLFEQQVLAGLRRRHRLLGVQMVRRRDRDDVDVGRREHIVVAGRDPRVGQRRRRTWRRFARARSASRAHSQVTAVRGLCRNAAMCCDAHQPTPQTATPSFRSAEPIGMRESITLDVISQQEIRRFFFVSHDQKQQQPQRHRGTEKHRNVASQTCQKCGMCDRKGSVPEARASVRRVVARRTAPSAPLRLCGLTRGRDRSVPRRLGSLF